MALQRPELTIPMCRDIVVDCTKNRKAFEDVYGSNGDTLLRPLGIVDPVATDSLRTCIQKTLSTLHYHIKKGDIVADPDSTVNDCLFSVNLNAH